IQFNPAGNGIIHSELKVGQVFENDAFTEVTADFAPEPGKEALGLHPISFAPEDGIEDRRVAEIRSHFDLCHRDVNRLGLKPGVKDVADLSLGQLVDADNTLSHGILSRAGWRVFSMTPPG